MVWRTASADLVQMKGFGSSLSAWMKAAMAALSSCTLRWTLRLICLSASSAGLGSREHESTLWLPQLAHKASAPDGDADVGSVLSRDLGGIGLDLTAAFSAPYDEPNHGRRGFARPSWAARGRALSPSPAPDQRAHPWSSAAAGAALHLLRRR